MPEISFFDTNVLVYASSRDGEKAAIAERLLIEGGVISVQVLNEFASVASRKQRLPWPRIRTFLDGVRSRTRVQVIDEQTHDDAIRLAERHRLSFYDALIVAAALDAGCDVLYTEDMHPGLVIDGRLTVINPFA